MSLRYYANASATTLVNSISNSDTALTVAGVTQFPTQFPYTLILDPETSTEEIVDVTNAVGAVLTVTRGADSSTAFSHAAGTVVHHGVSARDVREATTHINEDENVHGATGNLVDTGSTQLITGAKTFSSLATTAGGAAVTVGGTQTVTGAKTFTGDVTLPVTVNTPLGIVAVTESTADSALSVGASRIAVLGAGAALKAGRRYRVRARIAAVASTGGGFTQLFIHNLTTGVDWALGQAGVVKAAGVADVLEAEIPPYSATSDVTYTFQAQIVNGAGTIKMLHSATNKSFIYIEDLGEF